MEETFFLVYVYAIFLLIAASVPTSDLIRIQRIHKVFFSDKALHFFGFGLLAWFLCYGYHKAGRTGWLNLKSAVLSVGYGFVIEVIQIPLPYRVFSWDDLAADTAGVAVALIVFYVFISLRP